MDRSDLLPEACRGIRSSHLHSHDLTREVRWRHFTNVLNFVHLFICQCAQVEHRPEPTNDTISRPHSSKRIIGKVENSTEPANDASSSPPSPPMMQVEKVKNSKARKYDRACQ
jgi:hypothetical protein